jgi:hypothetical protein
MSALETTVRVSPEKQTLILAGEVVPRRSPGASAPSRPLTIVATPADETMLLMRDGDQYQASGSEFIPISRDFSSPPSPADAYLRTQALSSIRGRTHLVDTYA